MPLAVQVVGRRYNEELILRLMKEMESIAGFKKFLSLAFNLLSKYE